MSADDLVQAWSCADLAIDLRRLGDPGRGMRPPHPSPTYWSQSCTYSVADGMGAAAGLLRRKPGGGLVSVHTLLPLNVGYM
eukprot:908936-Prymnesium_polylepis.1